MKTFVVFVNYGMEGWKIADETDDFNEAVMIREHSMGMGNSDVVIFRPVILEVREKRGGVA